MCASCALSFSTGFKGKKQRVHDGPTSAGGGQTGSGPGSEAAGIIAEAGGLECLLDNALQRAESRYMESNRSLLQTLLQDVEKKTEERVTKAEEGLRQEMKELINPIRTQVTEMQTALRSLQDAGAGSTIAPTVYSATSAAPTIGASGARSADFIDMDAIRKYVPTKLEVKGFCSWDETRQSWKEDDMITNDEYIKWAADAVSKLEEGLRTKVDMKLTEERLNGRLLFHRIDLRLAEGTTRAEAWSLKEKFEELIGDGTVSSIQGRTPKVYVESHPVKQAYLNAGSKALGIFKRKGVDGARLKPEWGPPLTKIMLNER
eukprot:11605372-Karenia_brevis.AAC.1